MDKATDIRHIERRITQMKLELEELHYDEKVVKSNYTKKHIQDDINFLVKRIDRKEFELWKLNKE